MLHSYLLTHEVLEYYRWSVGVAPPRMVLPPLEAEKLVDGPQRLRIPGSYANLSSTVQRPELILDHRLFGGHGPGSRDHTGVHHAGNGEIARREGPGYSREVGPNGGHCGGVRVGLPQLHSAPVRQIVEAMPGGILIHPHGHSTPLLERSERGVGSLLRGYGRGVECQVQREETRGELA